MRMWLFTNNQNVGTSGEFSLNMEALFSPWVFLLAFVFCVVINLLSAALPAWIAARRRKARATLSFTLTAEPNRTLI